MSLKPACLDVDTCAYTRKIRHHSVHFIAGAKFVSRVSLGVTRPARKPLGIPPPCPILTHWQT